MVHRVVLVDDHHMVRQGLVGLIGGHPDFVVAGEARMADEAVERILEEPPDLVIADLILGTGPDGIQLTKAVKAEHPRLPVLILSGREESLFAERAILAGASGYLMKDEAVDVLFAAMESALAGGLWISRAMTERLLPASVEAAVRPVASLDGTQRELVEALRSGNRTVLGLSRELGQGAEAVERSLDQLCAALALPSRASLFLYLHRH